MDDLRAVMDAEGIERAAIVGISDASSMSALFAATYPDRVSSLVLWAAGAGPPASEEVRSALLPWVQDAWGSGEVMSALVRVGSRRDIERLAKLERYSMSPRIARALLAMNFDNDIRGVLPVISAPTLVIHRSGDPILRRDRAVALAELIPGARRVELPGDWHISLVDDEEAEALDIIEEFITGSRPVPGLTSTACSRRSCSPTSSTRRLAPQNSATGAGANCSTRTIVRPPPRSIVTAGSW